MLITHNNIGIKDLHCACERVLRRRAARLSLSGSVSASDRTGSSGPVRTGCAQQEMSSVGDREPDSVQSSVCFGSDLGSGRLDTRPLPPPDRPPLLHLMMSLSQAMQMLNPAPTCTAQPHGGSVEDPLYPQCRSGGAGECSQSGRLTSGGVSVPQAPERSCGCCRRSLGLPSLVLQAVWLHCLGWRAGFLRCGAGDTSQAVSWSDGVVVCPSQSLVLPPARPDDQSTPLS